MKRKKILLGDKDIISREIEDFQVEIQLSRTTRELMPNKYENSFDLLKQYKKERNTCRNFRIFGTINSAFIDCDNLNLHIFNLKPENIASPISLTPGFIKTVKSIPIISVNWDCNNLFFKKRGKYLIELDEYIDQDYVYIYIDEINSDLQNLFHRQLVYKYNTLNIMAEPVVRLAPYGSDEAIVDIDGNIIKVENDFDFFYNKHWINEAITIDKIRRTKWVGQEGTAECALEERVRGWIGDTNDTTCIQEESLDTAWVPDENSGYCQDENGEQEGYYLIINMSPAGAGTVAIDPVMDFYPPGTIVTATPVATGVYSNDGIEGDIEGVTLAAGVRTIPMTQNRIITFKFTDVI